MSLVEDSQAVGGRCPEQGCALPGNGHSGDIGKDAPLRDITFQDAINFLEKVQEKW